ncbi:MAG: hypothetical protein DRR06_12375 [Gammaproteobacteria bacterium]|nr:MAG: hypothetical protein DRR06_12375 [Gammaproteobacteria bacterium]RLA54850.1 MAG: hypothetical protein DRR42_00390 [Gammaproteobacteria bacterium]
MDWITLTANWFRENESVLSGIAALVAIVGILLSPLGGNIKALFSGAKPNTEAQQSPETKPGPSLDGPGRPAGKPTIYIEAFTGSSEAASTLALELYEEVRRGGKFYWQHPGFRHRTRQLYRPRQCATHRLTLSDHRAHAGPQQ